MRLRSVVYLFSWLIYNPVIWATNSFFDPQRLCVPRAMHTMLIEYRSTYSGEDKCYYILPFKIKDGSEYSMEKVKTICEYYDAQVLNADDKNDALFFKEAFEQSFTEKTVNSTGLHHSNMAIIYLSTSETNDTFFQEWCNYLNVYLNGTSKFDTFLCRTKNYGVNKLTNSHICWRYNVMSNGESKIDKETTAKIGKLSNRKTTITLLNKLLPTTVEAKKENIEDIQLTTAETPSFDLKPVWKVVYTMGIGILAIYGGSALFLVYTTERRLYYERKLAIKLLISKQHR